MDLLESDMKLLLDSLKCSPYDADQQIEALKTLAMLCNDDTNGDCIRKMGGIELITDVFYDASLPAIKQWSLYALSNALQNSRSNKRRLCSTNILAKIKILLDHREPCTLSVFAANFLLSLCSNFGYAQDLCRESGCLGKLILIFKATIPKTIEWFDSPDNVSKSLWTTVSSTLCCMMSDPQNDSNKLCCAEVLPQAISVLKNANKEILCSALNFISHVVNCNGKTQRMLKLVGGINSLVALLSRNNNDSDVPDEYITSLTLQTISSGLTHYALNKEIVGSLGIISTLIGLIKNLDISDTVQTSCLVCLSRCVDDCDMNAELLLKCNGVQTLVTTIVNATSEDARRIAILILQNSRLSKKGSRSMNTRCNKLPSPREDVLPAGVQEKHIQAERNSTEGCDHMELAQFCGSNAEVNITQNKNDSSILSLLKDHKRILTNVTRHVNELKDRFQEFSDASTTSSTKASRARHHRSMRHSEISSKSGNHSRYRGHSCFGGVTKKRMLLVPLGGAKSEKACGANIPSTRNSSLISCSTRKNFGTNSNRGIKMDMAKRAIINSHLKFNGPNLISGSKIATINDDSLGYKNRKPRITTSPLDHASYMAYRSPRKGGRPEVNVTSPTLQPVNVVKTHKSNIDRKLASYPEIADKYRNRLIDEKSKSIGGVQRENFHMKHRNNTDVRRLPKRDLNRRSQDLPTVLGNVPMLEQSCYEKVQGWIDTSLSPGGTNGNETKIELVEKRTGDGRDSSEVGGHDNSEWENVSSMMMSEEEDQSESPRSCDSRTDEAFISAEDSEFQDKREDGRLVETGHKESVKCSEIVQLSGKNNAPNDSSIRKHDRTHSSNDSIMIASSLRTQASINESITPPSALPTRFASYHHKAKRYLAFKSEDLGHSDSEECCSPIDNFGHSGFSDECLVPSKEEENVIHEAAPSSGSNNVTHDSPHSKACNGDYKDNDKVLADSTSLRDHPIQNETSKCLGCFPFARFPFVVLNKRNYIAALRTDRHTCNFHRQLILDGLQVKDVENEVFTPVNIRRVDEREPQSIKSKQVSNSPITKAAVLKSNRNVGSTQRRASPNNSIRKDLDECRSVATTTGLVKTKRKRQEYENYEVENLHEGVQAFGRRWTSILNTYDFKKGRTAEDLKDKYRQLSKRSGSTVTATTVSQSRRKPAPFTSEEIINLKTGYGRYGARWKTILKNFKFQHGRTAQDLEKRYSRFAKV